MTTNMKRKRINPCCVLYSPVCNVVVSMVRKMLFQSSQRRGRKQRAFFCDLHWNLFLVVWNGMGHESNVMCTLVRKREKIELHT